jgi:tetratricopeptide (TPR) repeat protein
MPIISKFVLLCLFICLLVTACTENEGMQYRYTAEKMLFQANKAVARAEIKPELNPPGTTDSLRNQFSEASVYCFDALSKVSAEKYPTEHNELSHLAYQSTSRLSQYLFAEQRYDSCIVLMTSLLSLEGLSPFERMYASINLGQVNQAVGNWDTAVAIYSSAVENYYPPLAPDGSVVLKLFNIPAHIFSIYTQIRDTSAAREHYLRAETYYRELMTQYPQSDLGTGARTTLAALYSATGQPDAAINQLREVTDSTGAVSIPAELQISEILATAKKDYRGTLDILDKLLVRVQGLPAKDRSKELEPLIMLKQAMVKLEQRRFAEARTQLDEISEKFPRFFDAYPTAQLAKARSFDLENNWDRAVTEYRFLIEHYEGSDEALSTYLYLERHFAEDRRPAEADRWYRMALQDYNTIINRGGPYAAKALTFKADLFRQRKEWTDAASALEELFNKFPDTRLGRQAILTASVLYRDKLKDSNRADLLLEQYKKSLLDLSEQPQLQDL